MEYRINTWCDIPSADILITQNHLLYIMVTHGVVAVSCPDYGTVIGVIGSLKDTSFNLVRINNYDIKYTDVSRLRVPFGRADKDLLYNYITTKLSGIDQLQGVEPCQQKQQKKSE